jgi:hypothetical protein
MVNHTISVLSILVQNLPIGTNLALLQFLWMLVSGSLLPSRGAIFPGLKLIGLEDAAIRRAWTAFRKGKWQMSVMLVLWREHVKGLSGWKEHRYEGYLPVTIDVTAFWRPALKKCPGKHYHPAANRALPAVIFGIVGDVCEINGQRLALPRAFERVHPKDNREKRLWQEMLKHAKKSLQSDEIAVIDAGMKIRILQEVGMELYILRLATNFTARRNYLPDHSLGRRPTYGALVRPLARNHKGKTLAASPTDENYVWGENGYEISVNIWRNLIFAKGVKWCPMKTTRALMFTLSMILLLINPGYWQPQFL